MGIFYFGISARSTDPILDLGSDLPETYSLGQISEQPPVK